MIEIIIATKNKNKLEEIKKSISIPEVTLISLLNLGNNIPAIVEDGKTFEENAVKKAQGIAQATGKLTLADDSGLEVDVLDGKPGVLSARFAHEKASDFENNRKLLDLLKDVPRGKRGARFVCVLALASPEKLLFTSQGTVQGYITDRPVGENGFGYDPLFARYEDHKTFAELNNSIKCRISHRAKALHKMGIHLESYLIKEGLI